MGNESGFTYPQEIVEPAIKRLDKAEQENMLLHRAFLAPLLAQTIEKPATPDAVDTFINHYRKLKTPLDTSSKQFVKEIDAYLEIVKQEFEKSCQSFGNNSQETHAQYIISLGRIIQGLDRVHERSFVQTQLEPLLFSYLELWHNFDNSNNETDPDGSIQQEAVLLALCDEKNKKQIESLRMLRQDGRISDLNSESNRMTNTLKTQVYINDFLDKFKVLDKALFDYLRSIKRLNLSNSGLAHITRLCDDLANAKIDDVAQYKDLTEVDVSYIGIRSPIFLQSVQRFFDPETDRRPLHAVINICAKLRMEIKLLPYMSDVAQLSARISKIKLHIENEINKRGDKKLNAYINNNMSFSALEENLTQATMRTRSAKTR